MVALKKFLLSFSFFRNWIADAWDEGWSASENWNTEGGLGADVPSNPYVRGIHEVRGSEEK